MPDPRNDRLWERIAWLVTAIMGWVLWGASQLGGCQ